MRRFLLFIVIFIPLLFPLKVSAKSYTIDSALIEIDLNSDGSANATETRTYTFDGHFENGEWNIDTSKNQVDPSRVSLSEEDRIYTRSDQLTTGTFTTLQQRDKLIVKWKYNADDETRKFTIKYDIGNAITNYADTAEFYWKFIGNGWDVPTRNIHASVLLPLNAPDTHLKAWGHGPLSGKVSIISPRRIDYDLNYLPPNTFFEGRVIFPPLENIPQTNEKALDRIESEEAGFIKDTIRQSERDRFDQIKFVIFILLVAGAFVWRITYWYRLWLKQGKELQVAPVNLAGTLHEPPSDLPPSLVNALLSIDFNPGTQSITATLLDLCRRKIVKITQEKQQAILGLFPQEPEIMFELVKDSHLSPVENMVIKLLYLDEISPITKSEILKKLRSDTHRLTDWNNYRDQVKEILLKDEFIDKESHSIQSRMVLDIVLGGVFSFVAIFLGQFFSLAPGRDELIIVSVLGMSLVFYLFLIPLYIFMDKRTSKGAKEAESWKAFKKFLKDYSVTKNYPLDSVIIWEKYLVYGAALGISLKALSQLPIKFADAAARSSYIYAAGFYDGKFDLDRVASSFSTLSASYGASGSGSSGGFSGGGGGGGGGSGGGMS